MPEPCIVAWSGGKDSALALHRILQDEGYEVKGLFTTLHGEFQRISMHGVREELLDLQAERTGIPLRKVHLRAGGQEEYDAKMEEALKGFKAEGVRKLIFGDIFLEDLREYREAQMAGIGMEAVFPLWKEDTWSLLKEGYEVGIRTVLCCCREATIGSDKLGQVLTPGMVEEFSGNVDPCGEYGEFHSFVVNAPYFDASIQVESGERVDRSFEDPEKGGEVVFHYIDLLKRKEL